MYPMHMRVLVFELALLSCAPGFLRAQFTRADETVVLSLAEARAIAVEANPDLLAAAWQPVATRGALRTARTLPFDPDVSFASLSPGRGLASRFEAELGVEIEVGGQRGLRRASADASLATAEDRLIDRTRHLLAEVSLSYQALVAAEERLALIAEIDSAGTQLHTAVLTQWGEGEVSRMEANLASIEAARARARRLDAETARRVAARELGLLLGRPDIAEIRTEGPTPSPVDAAARPSIETCVSLALSTRPDLAALDHDLERARQQVRLVRREVLPDLRVAGLMTREDPLSEPTFGVALGLSLPLFDRNQGETERSRAEFSEVQQLRDAMVLRIRTEVEQALLRLESAERETALLESELLGPIRENQGLLATAYREGKLDLAAVLLLRNQLLDAELSYWEAWERRESARVELERATGEILAGVPAVAIDREHDR